MSSSTKRSRWLRRDGFLCGIHLRGCGKRIESIRDASVDHIFTQSFFRKFEAPAEVNGDCGWRASLWGTERAVDVAHPAERAEPRRA